MPVEGDLRDEIARLQEGHAKVFPPARWTKPENLHLTLRFLGEVDSARLADVENWFEESLREARGGAIALAAPGHFRRGDGVVFWMGLCECVWLEEAAARLAGEIAGSRPETRGFVPHLTIGRLRLRPKERTRFEEFLRTYDAAPVPAARAEKGRFVLTESRLASGGPAYREIRSLAAG